MQSGASETDTAENILNSFRNSFFERPGIREMGAEDFTQWLMQASGDPGCQILFYDWEYDWEGPLGIPAMALGNPDRVSPVREMRLIAGVSISGGQQIEIRWARLDRQRRAWPSLSAHWPGAMWIEREIWEETGYEPMGHPDLRPILHPERSPLRGMSAGAGVFQLPLGPVRADVSESGLFLFETVGEQIMHLQPQLFYKHRAVEGLAVGRRFSDVAPIAERITGTSTAAHASAFARAVEQARGAGRPFSAERERVFFGEWERLYNHAHDFAQMASAAGMTVAQAQLARAKEDLLRVSGAVTGSRFLREVVRPFEASGLPWGRLAPGIRRRLSEVDSRVRHFTELLLHTPTFVDRLVKTGTLRPEWARSYGVVGPSARACGILNDVRALELAGLYAPFGYVPSFSDGSEGDARARFLVRLKEWTVSVRMIETALDGLESGAAAENGEDPGEAGFGIGLAESPRGRVCHVVRLGAEGEVLHWGVRSASAWIWPVFGLAVANGNIQTDFPVIDASFGLAYASVDR